MGKADDAKLSLTDKPIHVLKPSNNAIKNALLSKASKVSTEIAKSKNTPRKTMTLTNNSKL